MLVTLRVLEIVKIIYLSRSAAQNETFHIGMFPHKSNNSIILSSLNQTCCVNGSEGPGAFPSLSLFVHDSLSTVFSSFFSQLVLCPTVLSDFDSSFRDSASIRFLKSSRKLPSLANVFNTVGVLVFSPVVSVLDGDRLAVFSFADAIFLRDRMTSGISLRLLGFSSSPREGLWRVTPN